MSAGRFSGNSPWVLFGDLLAARFQLKNSFELILGACHLTFNFILICNSYWLNFDLHSILQQKLWHLLCPPLLPSPFGFHTESTLAAHQHRLPTLGVGEQHSIAISLSLSLSLRPPTGEPQAEVGWLLSMVKKLLWSRNSRREVV